MESRVLGPLEVIGEHCLVDLPRVEPRAVLAVLLLHANQPVTADRLALALWADDAPAGAIKTLPVHISAASQALGDSHLLTTRPAGYRLRVRPAELDAERFERRVREGRRTLAAGHPEHAAAVLREALSLWPGPPLADPGFESFAQDEIARLEEQRLTALEAELAAGWNTMLVGERTPPPARPPAGASPLIRGLPEQRPRQHVVNDHARWQ